MRTSTIVPAMLAGFFAGMVGANLGLRLTTVYAQGPAVEMLQSKSFVLLDSSGRKRGDWVIDPSGLPVLRLFDAQGQLIWDTTGTPRTKLIHER